MPLIFSTWEAVFTGPVGPRPKMFGKVLLDVKAEDGRITGTAEAGKWPGLAPISEGTIDGNRVSFTVIGQRGSTTGFPRMVFEGTVQGDKMTLTMTWGFVGSDKTRDLPMEATRTTR